jgi:hypothetical protein
MLSIARPVAQALKPVYGIGYTREHRLGPELYAIGIVQGLGLSGPEDEEALIISKWSYIGMVNQVYRDGLLRDVYPWNFLTQPQLSRPVGAVSLQEWIQSDPRHGTLSVLCDRVCLWEVSEADIPDIRQKLRQADVIFDWRKYP